MSDFAAERPMQVVVRALSVLTCLAEHPHGLNPQQLHARLGIPLASIYRIVATLEHEAYASRSASTRRYSLGPAAKHLGHGFDHSDRLVTPPDALLELAAITNETVFLTRLVESRVICVALVESARHLRLFVQEGQEMPLHAAASARVILAYCDPVLVDALLATYPKELYTQRTPRNAEAVISHLIMIRERGFDICENELDDDVWAVSAPVFDAGGRVEYGVTLAAAAAHMPTQKLQMRAIKQVLTTAKRLSTELGHRSRAHPYPTLESRTSALTADNGQAAHES